MPNSKPAPLISILSRTKTYNLGRMPNEEVAISLFLFAHDDAGYDWNWGEYRAWLDGFATNVTYLICQTTKECYLNLMKKILQRYLKPW